nr:transcriptional regulator, LacI family [uncultured bacterium]
MLLERLKISQPTTRYAQLAQQFGAQIRSGELKPGDRLPSFPELKAKLKISQHTWEHACRLLELEGLVRREPGRGVFVEAPRVKTKTGFVGYFDLCRNLTNHSPYFRQIQDGIRRGAQESGKNIIIIDSAQTFSRWDDLEGLLLCPIGESSVELLPVDLPVDLPVVNLLYNNHIYPSVRAADEAGVEALIDHLWNLGHRRIAHMSRGTDSLLQLRHQAYREALLQRGAEPLAEWTFSDPEPGCAYSRYGYEMMSEWLEKGWSETGCTAILAQNDLMALGVIKALREQSILVPEEISVVGFDGVEYIAPDGFNENYAAANQLTTVKVPLFEIGYAGMKVVLGEYEQMPVPPMPLQFPVKLIVGESSAFCVANSEAPEPVGHCR